MASAALPSQRPVAIDREYEEALESPPPGFVLKTAILPQGDEIWNSRRDNVINQFVERGVPLTRHNEFVTFITGYFKDVLKDNDEKKWVLQRYSTNDITKMCGPVEAMDMWLLEQPGATHFVPLDF